MYSKLKDPIPKNKINNVVYEIPCRQCNKGYIGQTKRNTEQRIKEHKTNINRQENEHTALTKHKTQSDHEFDYSNFKILAIEENLNKRLFIEMASIFKQKNSVNQRTDIENLSNMYHGILKMH